jgi:hypothetical protein
MLGVFLPLLSVLLIALKLTGVIVISWWWALAPVVIPLILGFVVVAIGTIIVWKEL